MSRLSMAVLPFLLLAAGPAQAHGPEEHGSAPAAAIGEPGDAAAQSRTIEITMQEGDGKMSFTPDVITVTKGEQVRLHLKNVGDLEHEFMIGTPEEIAEDAETMKAMPDMKHDSPYAQRFAPRASGSIVLKFTETGEFDFACLIPGHMEAGMKGKIIVK